MLLNCDLGEGFGSWRMGPDEDIMPMIDLANIACGFHAGDAVIMRRTLNLAIEHGVRVGAHVGYPDLAGFGRRALPSTADEVIAWTLYQYGALSSLARFEGTFVEYIKPHGALYHRLHQDLRTLDALCKALAQMPEKPSLMLMAGPAGKIARKCARDRGVHVMAEAFADRGYMPDGRLVPRGQAGAVLQTRERIGEQIRQLKEGYLALPDDMELSIAPTTLCVHSDSPEVLDALSVVRAALQD